MRPLFVLALMLSAASQVACIIPNRIYASSAATAQPLSLPTVNLLNGKVTTIAANVTVFVYGSSNVGEKVRLYSLDQQLVASVVADFARTLSFASNLNIFAGGKVGYALSNVVIQVANSVPSMTNNPVLTLQTTYLAEIKDLSASYIFMGLASGASSDITGLEVHENAGLARFDHLLLVYTPSPDGLFPMGGSPTGVFLFEGSTVLLTGYFPGALVYDKASLSLVGYPAVDGYALNSAELDSQQSNRLFFHSQSSSSVFDSNPYNSQAGYDVSYNHAPLSLPLNGRVDLRDIPSQGVLMVVFTQGTAFLVSKSSFALVSQSLILSGSTIVSNSAVGFFTITTSSYTKTVLGAFTSSDGLSATLRSYFMIFDYSASDTCLVRDPVTLVCSSCTTGYLLSSLASENFCVAKSDVGPGFGLQPSTGVIVPCLDSKCLDCLDDYSVCKSCVNDTSIVLLSSTCLNTSLIPLGQGINWTGQVLANCSQPGCLNCSLNYTQCKLCNADLNYVLNGTTCTVQTVVQALGYGPNNVTGIMEPCKVAFCSNCSTSSSVCLQCNYTLGYFLFNSTTCLLRTRVPDGFGVDPVSNSLRPCLNPTACQKCNLDYRQCSTCNSSRFYYMLAQTCRFVTDLPLGYGANALAATAQPCNVNNCIDCRPDYNTCIECNKRRNYHLRSTGVCKEAFLCSDIRYFIVASYIWFDFLEPLFDFNILKFSIEIVVNCGPNCHYLLVLGKDYSVYQQTGTDLYLLLNSTQNIYNGSITITITNPDIFFFNPTLPWTPTRRALAAPTTKIVLDEIYYQGSKTYAAYQTTVRVLTDAMKTIFWLVFKFLIPAIFLGVGLELHKLISSFSLLQVLGGPYLMYPAVLIHWMTGTSLIPEVPNNPGVDTSGCGINRDLVKNGISCSLLANQGTNLLIVVGFLLLWIAVRAIETARGKPSSNNQVSENTSQHWFKRLVRTFSLRQTFSGQQIASLLEGFSVPLISCGMITLVHYKPEPIFVASIVVLSLLLVFYSGQFYIFWRSSLPTHTPVRKSSQDISTAGTKDDPVTQISENRPERTAYLTDCLVQGDNQRRVNRHAQISMALSYSQAIVAGALAKSPVAQISAVAAIQLLVCVNTAIGRTRATPFLNRTDFAKQMSLCVLLGLKLLAFGMEDETTRQEKLGMLIALVLGFYLLAGIVEVAGLAVLKVRGQSPSAKPAFRRGLSRMDSMAPNLIDRTAQKDDEPADNIENVKSPKVVREEQRLKNSSPTSIKSAPKEFLHLGFVQLTSRTDNTKLTGTIGSNPDGALSSPYKESPEGNTLHMPVYVCRDVSHFSPKQIEGDQLSPSSINTSNICK